MKKETIYRLNIDMYHTSVYVVFTDDVNQSRLKRSDMLGELVVDMGGVDALSSYKDGWHYLFFSPKPRLETVVHETFHTAHRVLEYVGVEFHTKNHEPFAYLQEFIFKYVQGCMAGRVRKRCVVKLRRTVDVG